MSKRESALIEQILELMALAFSEGLDFDDALDRAKHVWHAEDEPEPIERTTTRYRSDREELEDEERGRDSVTVNDLNALNTVAALRAAEQMYQIGAVPDAARYIMTGISRSDIWGPISPGGGAEPPQTIASPYAWGSEEETNSNDEGGES